MRKKAAIQIDARCDGMVALYSQRWVGRLVCSVRGIERSDADAVSTTTNEP